MTAPVVTGSVAGRWRTRLEAAVTARGRLCVGIDPHAALLESWGLEDTAAGLAANAATRSAGVASDAPALTEPAAAVPGTGEERQPVRIIAPNLFSTAPRPGNP